MTINTAHTEHVSARRLCMGTICLGLRISENKYGDRIFFRYIRNASSVVGFGGARTHGLYSLVEETLPTVVAQVSVIPVRVILNPELCLFIRYCKYLSARQYPKVCTSWHPVPEQRTIDGLRAAPNSIDCLGLPTSHL